jgi:hypothetical protein
VSCEWEHGAAMRMRTGRGFGFENIGERQGLFGNLGCGVRSIHDRILDEEIGMVRSIKGSCFVSFVLNCFVSLARSSGVLGSTPPRHFLVNRLGSKRWLGFQEN